MASTSMLPANPLPAMLELIPVLDTVLDPKLLESLQIAYYTATGSTPTVARIMHVLAHLSEHELVAMKSLRLEDVGGEIILIKRNITNGG